MVDSHRSLRMNQLPMAAVAIPNEFSISRKRVMRVLLTAPIVIFSVTNAKHCKKCFRKVHLLRYVLHIFCFFFCLVSANIYFFFNSQVKHCILIANGDIDRATQILLHRQEAGQSLKGNPNNLQSNKSLPQIDETELKNRIISR